MIFFFRYLKKKKKDEPFWITFSITKDTLFYYCFTCETLRSRIK